MRYALFILVLALAAPAEAQDCTFSLTGKKAGFVPDTAATDSLSLEIAVPRLGETAIAVATSPDTLCHVTDANATDGEGAVQVPEGEYTVLARATGKKGGALALGDQGLSRGKGKPLWSDLTGALDAGDGASWAVSNAGLGTVQVRLIPAVPEP